MKVIIVFYDTLRRNFLPPYGNDWVHAPNFKRLAEKTVIFDNYYAGSLPCMPARRELHTGRYNFLHRSWGPIEPFDDSMPKILGENGIYTHLVSDHYHYWEDGGCTYHTKYNTWEIIRGHEGDPWKGHVKDPKIPDHVPNMREYLYTGSIHDHWRQDWINRKYMQEEEQMPQAVTFKRGLEFIETNYQEDNWLLQIETFDPHEPFYAPKKFRELYEKDYKGPHFDWPNYSVVVESPEQVEHCIKQYAASVSMCDYCLGKVLDIMDEKDMWNDTMLIVTTDHGFLLSEKGWWGKMVPPNYDEIAHIPLFIWDPRVRKKNERRKALCQTIDLAPTILDFFGIKKTKDMQGFSLKDTIESDKEIREAALFGFHGEHVNVTDGKYVYMRAAGNPKNEPLFDYTLMPTHMNTQFSVNEMRDWEPADPFSFTKGCRTMKIKTRSFLSGVSWVYGTLLFDLQEDPFQEHPIVDPEVEKRMIQLMVKLMRESDAPLEQYERLGIPIDGNVKEEHLRLNETRADIKDQIGNTEITWKNKGMSLYYFFFKLIPEPLQNSLIKGMEKEIEKRNLRELNEDIVLELYKKLTPKSFHSFFEGLSLIAKQKGK